MNASVGECRSVVATMKLNTGRSSLRRRMTKHLKELPLGSGVLGWLPDFMLS